MKRLFYAGLIALLVVTFGAGLWTGIWFDHQNLQMVPADISQNATAAFDLVKQAWTLTENNYVDKAATRPQRLAYGSIAGMISSLGDTGHSTFLTPEEVKLTANMERGQFEGVGLEVQEKSGHVVVVAPIEGSPAQKAGIRSGDIILKVDGTPVTSVSDAVQRILGPAGTKVTLTIQTPADGTKDVSLTRARITVQTVSWQKLPGTTIAHLRLSSFSRGATSQMSRVIAAIKAQGNTGIILDLRDNPGGLLDEAVGVASLFLKSGNALLVKDAKGTITPIPVNPRSFATDLPMVVLINQGTASAAEIVAGALHDAGRATLVGTTTFGTGTVLNQFDLSDGSALLLAIEEWLTPSGKTIWHTGLPPDQAVPLAAGQTPLFPSAEQDMTADQVKASGDQQLLKALSLLSG